jgi:hypothetical protein
MRIFEQGCGVGKDIFACNTAKNKKAQKFA